MTNNLKTELSEVEKQAHKIIEDAKTAREESIKKAREDAAKGITLKKQEIEQNIEKEIKREKKEIDRQLEKHELANEKQLADIEDMSKQKISSASDFIFQQVDNYIRGL
ncbi:hypothetical protein JW930_07240 [Candidatus Woesearchaeota archaeon]|nr:hypothetical protein [Candidatus Woesearchaeota archaeon]